jgi:transposase
MFVVCRKLTGSARTCVLICQSVRSGNKVVQKTIKYYGVAHNEEQRAILIDQAKQEILRLKTLTSKTEKAITHKDLIDPCGGALLGHTVERFRIIEGFHTIFGPIFDEIGLSSLFTNIRYNQLRDVVIARVAQPSSKLSTAELLTTKFSRPLSESQIYRLMDEVVDLEDKIKLKVFECTNKSIQKQKAELILFDVTTLYFESQKSDELREFGYSKDHKIGETQVVLALATTTIGSPIGYHLFKGNTAEVSTLLTCLEGWKKLFDIKDVMVVADRAMMAEDNLKAMEDAELNCLYVIAAKLKKMPKKLRDQILERKEESQEQLGEETISLQEHDCEGRRLIVQYSEKRAHKDAKDRERLIEKVRKKLDDANKTNTRKLVTNRGYLKFLDEEKAGQAVLNEKKIEEEKRWDGLHGIITNDKESKAIDLLARYRRLWVIEESFRINKHTLSMRPIYHFTPDRIKAHILICYLAFAITRYAQQKINIFDNTLSIEKIRDALADIEVGILEDKTTGQFYKYPSRLGKEAAMIYRAMGVRSPEGPSRYTLKRKKCSVTKKI